MSVQPKKTRTSTSKSEASAFSWLLNARGREAAFILVTACGLFLFLSLFTYQAADPGWSKATSRATVVNAGGIVGAWFSDLFYYAFGLLAYLFPAVIFYAAWHLLCGQSPKSRIWSMWALRIAGFVGVLLGGCALMQLYMNTQSHLPVSAGGITGVVIGDSLQAKFNLTGATLVLATMVLIGSMLATGVSWLSAGLGLLQQSFFTVIYLLGSCKRRWIALLERFAEWQVKRQRRPTITTLQVNKTEPLQQRLLERHRISPTVVKAKSLPKPIKIKNRGGFPSLQLLEEADRSTQISYTRDELNTLSQEVEAKLLDFGVQAQVAAVHPGPVITRFELELAPGLKVSKVSGLAKDLARALTVESVRVVEVIPGRPVVGLEIPNVQRAVVRLKEVLSSREYQMANSPLSMGLGKDISGTPVVVDLAKMPHLLVAGTTGSGKSVGLNAMLLSLLYKSQPEEVRLIMIDPKMLELAVYEGIGHLLAPVVTDMKEAANALRWCVAEMERRYRLMAALGVRNMQGFNQKVQDARRQEQPLKDPLWPEMADEEAPELETLPYIVVVVDEFADMIMVVGKKVEELIARIAQKARAAGIHLILATQRPSVDVITGLIKANVPTRIAFQVASRVDSRTILDQQGAEQLLGRGDMLYLPPGTSLPVRVHGAFVADHEVHQVVEDWKARSEPSYNEDILTGQHQTSVPGMSTPQEDGSEADPLYDEAVMIVTESRRASISMVQRRLKVGYNRSARLIEQMELAGVVSPLQSNGTREVLAPKPVTA